MHPRNVVTKGLNFSRRHLPTYVPHPCSHLYTRNCTCTYIYTCTCTCACTRTCTCTCACACTCTCTCACTCTCTCTCTCYYYTIAYNLTNSIIVSPGRSWTDGFWLQLSLPFVVGMICCLYVLWMHRKACVEMERAVLEEKKRYVHTVRPANTSQTTHHPPTHHPPPTTHVRTFPLPIQ